MNDYRDIITIEPGKRSGQPCIRGMRITVYDVFEYLASGMTVVEVLHDFPELTEDQIFAPVLLTLQTRKNRRWVYTDENAAYHATCEIELELS